MQYQLPGVQSTRLHCAAQYCVQRCLQILTWPLHVKCSSMVSLNSLNSEIAIACVLFPSIQRTKALKARCSSSRWAQVGCPDSLHLPNPVQQSNAIKISLVFPLSLNLACGPQMIAIVNPFRKWTVERARREERGKERAHELIVKKSGERRTRLGESKMVA